MFHGQCSIFTHNSISLSKAFTNRENYCQRAYRSTGIHIPFLEVLSLICSLVTKKYKISFNKLHHSGYGYLFRSILKHCSEYDNLHACFETTPNHPQLKSSWVLLQGLVLNTNIWISNCKVAVFLVLKYIRNPRVNGLEKQISKVLLNLTLHY
jgi:hypothetical protein